MIIFKELDDLLSEAFDTPSNVKWSGPTGMFKTKSGNTYVILLGHDKQRDIMRISFERYLGKGETTYNLTKGNDSRETMEVFSTVIDAAIKKAKDVDPKYIQFDSYEDKDKADAAKRNKLYKRLAKKYAKEHGYDLRVSGSTFTMVNDNIKDKHDESAIPTGLTRGNDVSSIKLTHANDAAFFSAFDVKGSVVKRLPNGHIVMRNTESEKVVTLMINNELESELNPRNWEEVLNLVVWKDPKTGDETAGPELFIGYYDDWYVVLSGVSIHVYYTRETLLDDFNTSSYVLDEEETGL